MKFDLLHLPGKTFLILFVFCLLYTGCSRQKRQAQGLTLTEGLLAVGLEVGYPPMEYFDRDGKTLLGFDVDLARALAEKLGLRVTFIDTAWEGILAGLDTGRYDLAMNITILPGRQKNYNFTKPYIDSSITIVARKESAVKIDRPEDMAGFRVAFQSDTTAQYFTENLQAGGTKLSIFAYDKILNCFDELRLGRVDLLVVDNIAAHDYTEKADSPFEPVWRGPSGEFIGICLKKGNDALTHALNNALDELFADGALTAISQKTFNRDFVSPVR